MAALSCFWRKTAPTKVAPTPCGTGSRAPTFTNDWARGEPRVEEQESDQTVLIITKALTKTSNFTRRARNLNLLHKNKSWTIDAAG